MAIHIGYVNIPKLGTKAVLKTGRFPLLLFFLDRSSFCWKKIPSLLLVKIPLAVYNDSQKLINGHYNYRTSPYLMVKTS
jgi:hypothetical protein